MRHHQHTYGNAHAKLNATVLVNTFYYGDKYKINTSFSGHLLNQTVAYSAHVCDWLIRFSVLQVVEQMIGFKWGGVGYLLYLPSLVL